MTKILIFTAALCGVLALPLPSARAQKSPMAEAAYARAQDHLAASRFVDAANEMDTAVRYEPRFAFGWYVLASTRRRAGDCDRAVAAYRRYMELRPTEVDPYFGTGLCLQIVGDREAAISAFQHYIDTDHRVESAPFIETARKRLADLQRLAAANTAAAAPSQPVVEARQLREQGRTEDAIARFRAAAAADPKSAQARAELGALLASARQPKEAVEAARAAVRLAPADAPAWYTLAFALREMGQTEEAVAAYRRYITLKPKDPDPHYGLGRALVTLGRDDEAAAAFREYATLETRLTERRWLKKARAEIARIEGKRGTSPASMATGRVTPPAMTAPPAPTATTPPAPTTPAAPTPAAPKAPAEKSAPPPHAAPAGHP